MRYGRGLSTLEAGRRLCGPTPPHHVRTGEPDPAECQCHPDRPLEAGGAHAASGTALDTERRKSRGRTRRGRTHGGGAPVRQHLTGDAVVPTPVLVEPVRVGGVEVEHRLRVLLVDEVGAVAVTFRLCDA